MYSLQEDIMADYTPGTIGFQSRGNASRKSSHSRIPTSRRHSRSQSTSISIHRPQTASADQYAATIIIPLDRIPPNMPQLTGIRLAALRVPDENIIAEVYGLVVWQAHQLRLHESEKTTSNLGLVGFEGHTNSSSGGSNNIVCEPPTIPKDYNIAIEAGTGIPEHLEVKFDTLTAESEHIEDIRNEKLSGTDILATAGVNSTAKATTAVEGTATGGNEVNAKQENRKEETDGGKQGGGSLENYTFSFTPPGEQMTIQFPHQPPVTCKNKNANTKVNGCKEGEDVLTIRARRGHGKITVYGKIPASPEDSSERIATEHRTKRQSVKLSSTTSLHDYDEMDDAEWEDSLLRRLAIVTMLVGYLVWIIMAKH